MSVKKIFMTLIIVVACVMIGAFLLNVLLPNATAQLVDQVENQIYKATGLTFDLNNNGTKGTNQTDVSGSAKQQDSAGNSGMEGGSNVEGWQ